jgi:nicotinamide-nucleotide amidase
VKIELICTGSELLTGRVNTNAAYIGSRLLALGFELYSVTDVWDREHDLLCAFKRAFKRSEAIIVTGGLGPTFDDITVEIAAKCLRLKLYTNKKVLKSIKDYFLSRKVDLIPKINAKQANIIDGAKVLENRLGTAPGQMLRFEFKDGKTKHKKTLFLLPGPPKEMSSIFESEVVPFFKNCVVGIKKVVGIRKNEVLHIFGISESAVAEMIRPVLEEAKFGVCKSVEFGIIANASIVDLKFSVSGTNENLVSETIKSLRSRFDDILKDYIFGANNDTLASVVGRLLLENRKTISLAESCTGGKIAAMVTDIQGSSLYFKNSIVAYSNESKIKFLEVKKETLMKFGAVSPETAEEMAKGVLKLSGSDYAFSVTGIAGPDGGTKEKPVGLVYVGFSDQTKTKSFKFNFTGERNDIRERSANTVLDLLRKKLISLKANDH